MPIYAIIIQESDFLLPTVLSWGYEDVSTRVEKYVQYHEMASDIQRDM